MQLLPFTQPPDLAIRTPCCRAQIAIVSSVLVASTMYLVVSEARRIRTLFYLDPEECVTFEELQDIYPPSPPPLSDGSASRGPVSRQRTNVD